MPAHARDCAVMLSREHCAAARPSTLNVPANNGALCGSCGNQMSKIRSVPCNVISVVVKIHVACFKRPLAAN